MTGFIIVAIVVVAAVAAEVAFPGRDLYHSGWYNVALAALLVVVVAGARQQFRAASTVQARWGIVAIAAGVLITGLAGVANGLLAPDNRTVIGAPGQQVHVDELGGLLVFPLIGGDAPGTAPVTLERAGRSPLAIGVRSRDTGNFVLHATPRDVVSVEARDLRGNRLTITQPSGATFLSPVLLMEQRQTIAEMNLPYDSFSVPALKRIVKAVMFTPAQAALLRHDAAIGGDAAVLFAVDDENDRPLPHAIALSTGGKEVRAGGLALRGTVATYPAVEIIAVPALVAVVLGALLVLGGLVALVAR